MVSPLSNDKILPPTPDRSNSAADKRSGSTQDNPTGSNPTNSVDDTVNLSSAGRLVSQEASTARSGGHIENAEQAKAIVSRIREQIESAGDQAVKAHSQVESGQLSSLLESTAA